MLLPARVRAARVVCDRNNSRWNCVVQLQHVASEVETDTILAGVAFAGGPSGGTHVALVAYDNHDMRLHTLQL